MPFLHLVAKGAQVLSAGLPLHLEGRHFANYSIVCLDGWFLEDCVIYNQGLFRGTKKILHKYAIYNEYE